MRAGQRALLGFLLGLACACSAGDGDEPGTTADQRSARFDPSRGASAEELATLEREVAERPDDPQAHQRYGRALRDGRRNDEAIAQFERAVELAPDDPRLKLDLALAYSTAAHLDRAEAIYDELLAVPELMALALHNKGNLALRQDELDRAIDLYRQALAIKPEYMLALYHLGVALEQKGEYRDAYRTFGQALKLEPPEGDPVVLGGYIDALYRMGKLDLQMGATERGAQILGELLETYPEHPNAHYQYAQALMRLGRQEEAAQHFELHMQILARQEPSGPVATGD